VSATTQALVRSLLITAATQWDFLFLFYNIQKYPEKLNTKCILRLCVFLHWEIYKLRIMKEWNIVSCGSKYQDELRTRLATRLDFDRSDLDTGSFVKIERVYVL